MDVARLGLRIDGGGSGGAGASAGFIRPWVRGDLIAALQRNWARRTLVRMAVSGVAPSAISQPRSAIRSAAACRAIASAAANPALFRCQCMTVHMAGMAGSFVIEVRVSPSDIRTQISCAATSQ